MFVILEPVTKLRLQLETLLPVHTHIPPGTEIQILSASQSIAFSVQKNVGCISSPRQPRSSILTGSEHILTTVRSAVRFIIRCQVNVHQLCYACKCEQEETAEKRNWKLFEKVDIKPWAHVEICTYFVDANATFLESGWKTWPRAVRTTTFPPSPEINTCRWDRGGLISAGATAWQWLNQDDTSVADCQCISLQMRLSEFLLSLRWVAAIPPWHRLNIFPPLVVF